MIPLSYEVNYMVTTQENLDKIDVEPPKNLTYNTLSNLIEKTHDETGSVFSYYYYNNIFQNLISENGLELSNQDDLRRYIDLCREELKRGQALGYAGGSVEDFYGFICDGKVLMASSQKSGGNCGEFDLFSSVYNIVENYYNETFVILNTPTFNPDSATAYIDVGCAININSKHKNDSFKFVEFMMSERCQYSDTIRTHKIPVNNIAFNKAKKDFMNDDYYNKRKAIDEYLMPLPDEVKESYLNLHDSITEYKFIGSENYIIEKIIKESLNDYYNGKFDYDTLIERISSKLSIYYNE